jgi:hypothetical protein
MQATIDEVTDCQTAAKIPEALELFGDDVTPEALEAYVHANFHTGAQHSLMTALALATA